MSQPKIIAPIVSVAQCSSDYAYFGWSLVLGGWEVSLFTCTTRIHARMYTAGLIAFENPRTW